jgi:signal transduction histidine kinase
VNAKSTRKCIDIVVSDNGIGIPGDMIGKLFRIDGSTTRTGTANEEGSGLGLALCREFVEKNNGTIKVTSKPGRGTNFSVRLPRPEE